METTNMVLSKDEQWYEIKSSTLEHTLLVEIHYRLCHIHGVSVAVNFEKFLRNFKNLTMKGLLENNFNENLISFCSKFSLHPYASTLQVWSVFFKEHVTRLRFGLPYYWFFMAYPTIFSLFCELQARGYTAMWALLCTVMQVCTPYHCKCAVYVRIYIF